jgi:DNA replication protein DnaC
VAEILTDLESPYYQGSPKLKGEYPAGIIPFGGSGLGKTAAAWAAIRSRVYESHHTDFEFVKTVRFIGMAKARYVCQDAKEEFDEKFQRLLTVELLVLDDFLTERFSPSAEEVLFELLDTRTEQELFTIITTNKKPEEMAQKFPLNAAKIMRRINQFFLKVNFDKT